MRHAHYSPMPALPQAANAAMDMMDPARPRVSLAAILENVDTRPQLGEWLHSPTTDIHARLVHFASASAVTAASPSDSASASASAAPSVAAAIDGRAPSSSSLALSSPYTKSLRSAASPSGASMAPAAACIHQQSTASTHPPSLYNFSDATPTETSISTGLASQLSGMPLLEDVNGIPERRPTQYRPPLYECAFWFLNCSYISYDQDEWKTHCLSHFRGQEPPTKVQCPLCDWHGAWEDGFTAWSQRMEHVARSHAAIGETLKTSRPDFYLFTHLWRKRLIGDQDLKELKGGNHNLTRLPTNFVITHSRREMDGRRQGSQRVGRRFH